MEQLLQDLKQENYKNVYLLCGEEAYLRNQYKKKLRDALVAEGDTMNYAYYEGKDMKILSNMTNQEKFEAAIADCTKRIPKELRQEPLEGFVCSAKS